MEIALSIRTNKRGYALPATASPNFGTMPHLVILSTVPTKFCLFTLAVETGGYLYKVPLRALHLSGNNFVGTVLSAAKNLVLYHGVALFYSTLLA
jgi:hypothetical protein